MIVSEQDLCLRYAADGDEAAFAALVERHAGTVLAACRRILGNHQDAEDTTQAAFCILCRKLSSRDIDTTRPLAPWLHRVASNLAHNALRDRRTREHHHREASAMPPAECSSDISDEIDAALGRLPERERSAIVLFHFEGRSLADIAGRLSRPESTIGRWLQTGRERLRGLLSQRGVTLGGAALLSALGALTAAEVPAGFVAATAKVSLSFAASGVTSMPATALALKECRAMKLAALVKSAILAAACIAVLGTAGLIVAADSNSNGNGKGKADPNAPLGSTAFFPTPARTVGWRGDWTGRYPGATPPIVWGRWARGAGAELREQSQKPGKAKDASSQPVCLGIVREWLLLGPFPVADAKTGIDQELLPSEAQQQPDAGVAVGSLAWKPLHVSMATQTNYDVNGNCCGAPWVNFEYAFGKTTNQVAYAHSYLVAKTAGKVDLEIDWCGDAMKIWVNGNPIAPGPALQKKRIAVDLVQGVNRLLVKAAYGTPKNSHPNESIWRFCIRVFPTAPISYESRNLAWMTYLPGTTTSQPTVVGERIFVAFANSDLVCMDKADGKLLWLRSNYQYDGMTEADRAAYPDLKGKLDPLLAKMKQANDEVIKAINAAISPSGVAPDRLEPLKVLLRNKDTIDRSIHNEITALDAKKYPKLYDSEVSSCDATPCSDGKFVYAVYGGGRDKAGTLIVCYDLEGNRQWSFHEALGAGEHSNHASPVLLGNRLIHTVNKTILGFDAKTGKVEWRQTSPGWYLVESSPWPVRIGTTAAIAVGQVIARASDGQKLWTAQGQDNYFWHTIWHVPIFEDGVVYSRGLFAGPSPHECVVAVRLSEKSADQWGTQITWKIKNSEVVPTFKTSEYTPMSIASPLYHDGLLYGIDMMGLLQVVDAKTGTQAYLRTIDMNQLCTRSDYGVCASPTLGGKHIFLLDGMGGTLVLDPGATYKEVGRNTLEDFDGPFWGDQERFFTSPVFDGASILMRGRGYLYCIREK